MEIGSICLKDIVINSFIFYFEYQLEQRDCVAFVSIFFSVLLLYIYSSLYWDLHTFKFVFIRDILLSNLLDFWNKLKKNLNYHSQKLISYLSGGIYSMILLLEVNFMIEHEICNTFKRNKPWSI